MIAEHAQSECARSMRAVRANSSAVPFEWVAEREKGKNMDRLSIFCRSLAGGAIIGIGVLIAQQAVAQESVSVRAQMVHVWDITDGMAVKFQQSTDTKQCADAIS